MDHRNIRNPAFEPMVSRLVKKVAYKSVQAHTSSIAVNSTPAVAVGLKVLFEWVECASAALYSGSMGLDGKQRLSLRHCIQSK